MPSSDSSRDALLERLAEEFVERHRRGERPALSEYADRHPDLAAEIRDLFPALVKIEHLKPVAGDLTGAHVPESDPDEGPTLERLGDYRILREVGHGGMGVVYEAEQESLGRHVALKVLPRQALLKATYLERFRREAKAAARLHHTNIVPVFGVGECDGMHYFAMQFIVGEGLDKVVGDLRRLRAASGTPTVSAIPSEASVAHSLLTGRFAAPAAEPAEGPPVHPVPAVSTATDGAHGSSTLSAGGPEGHYFRGIARVAVQVADALAYAHRQGILHRDIKPSNLLLDQQGTVWITDFGLAKAEGADDLTQTGDIVGTVRFMAPERFDGRSLPESDVYALGVTLYEMLTLRPAFDDANKARLVEKVLHEPPLPPRKIDPRIPRDLETVVLKCLAKDPAERYASAEALAEDVRRFLADRPIQARRSTWRERAWRWCRRNPAVATLSAALLLLLAGAAGYGVVMSAHLRQALGQTQAERDKADDLREVARREAYRAQMSLVQHDFEATNIEHVRGLLDRYAPQPGESDLRHFEWYYWQHRSHLEQQVLRGHTEPVFSVAYSPDGRHLASGDWNGSVYLWNAETGQYLRTLSGHKGRVSSLAFSRDGHWMASASWDRSVVVWNAHTGTPRHHLKGHTDAVAGVAFNTKGDRLASAGLDGTVRLWDAQLGKPLHTLKEHTNSVWSVAFHPDASLLVSGSDDKTVRLWDPKSGKLLHTLLGHSSAVYSVAFDPEGRRVASGGFDNVIHFWDVTSGQKVRTLEGHKGGISSIAFSPDGHGLASASWDNTVRLWDAHSGQELLLFHGHSAVARGVAFRPDGRQLASAGFDHTVRLWNTARSQGVLLLRGHRHEVWNLAFRFDGQRLASASWDGTVGVWDAADGRQLLELRGHTGWVLSVAFSSDGCLLASAGADKTTRLWDAASGKCLHILQGHTDEVWRTAFHPDGRHLVTASKDRTVRLWEVASGKLLHTLSGHTGAVSCVVFSPDGKRLASAGEDKTVRLWDADSGEALATLQTHSKGLWGLMSTVAFSPDSRHLAWAGSDHLARIWEVESGKHLLDLVGHRIEVRSVTFSPNGQRLATASGDTTVRLWDADSGQPLLTLQPDLGGVSTVAFSPDGRRLAAGGVSGSVRIWETAPLPESELRQREAVFRVQTLFSELGLREEVYHHLRTGRWGNEEDRKLALQVAGAYPESVVALQELAWRIVKAPGQDHRAYDLALRQAKAALRLAPTKDNRLRSTLGIALYRNGQYAPSVVTLEKGLAAGGGKRDAFDLFFLALCHAKLGEPAKAKDCFDRAVKWVAAQKTLPAQDVQELKAFRAEAEAELRAP
jgi:WD40 repeat protein/serine/threonine protein kinase